jgi:hypothetical protein
MSDMFIKLGEAVAIGASDIQSPESVFADSVIDERFKKFANELRRIAPKANDFLYFSCVMIHSAEAALVNSDGSPKLTSRGEPIEARWEVKGDSLKWICNDPNVKGYRNSNGDIFPESELLKAYKVWIGKPLCVDHKSASVDAIRGVILDTYYDRKLKRVIGLCALDKVSYPELARGITAGYKTSVSMGTGVGRAICFDCGAVARTERDFCTHMRTKSCYGEINADLQPIELSIVVNGADPQAKIREIIASAQQINAQLTETEEEFASVVKSAATPEEQKLEMKVEHLRRELEKLKSIVVNWGFGEKTQAVSALDPQSMPQDIGKAEDTNNAAYGQSSGQLNPPVDETNQNAFTLNLPNRLASNNDVYINEVKNLVAGIQRRLNNMEMELNTLTNKEGTMATDSINKEAYFQGGGGVNEPTPGQRKYPIDPKNEQLREKSDKQMVGESPFPEVGPVDGMHPSPSSVEPKDELERKKMLLRAEQEGRSMRRAAALQKAKENIMSTKEAYWQGGGGVNEPTPGEKKYPVDPKNEKLRDNSDKQMVGQKPFPGVGDVDGLHPSPASVDEKDELERKKMLSRASTALKAKFVRAANSDGTDNLGKSAWHVFSKDESGEKLVFTASVDDITGGRSEVLFDTIATKEFATKMLEKIRAVGFEKASSLYKNSQAVAGPGATPGAPADAGGAAPMMPEAAPADASATPEDQGGKGDPKDTAMKLSEKLRDDASDLVEAVRALTGEQAQMGDMEQGLEALPKAASEVLAPLYEMRRNLHTATLSGAKKAITELKEHAEELDLIASVVNSNLSVANKEYVDTVVEDAFVDARKASEDAEEILKSFASYVRGAAGLVKRAEEAKLLSIADEDLNDARKAKKSEEKSEEKKSDKKKDKEDKEDEKEDEDKSDADDNAHMHMHDELELPEHNEEEEPSLEDLDLPDELKVDDMNDTMVELPAGTTVPTGAKSVAPNALNVPKMAFDLTTKEGRTAYRAKIAADATGKEEDGEIKSVESMPHSDMLDQADKLADGQTKLDVKPADELGLIETLPEQQKKDLEVARAEPKVRKEAERLNQLISEGKVSASELDSLVAKGLDPEVIKYWKQYYGQAGKEGSEFAKLLTTETMKAKAEEEITNHKIKLGRAYELANEMVRRGLLEDDRASVSAQVDQIMLWNDEGFDSMKRVIAKHPAKKLQKQASAPIMGYQDDALVSTASEEATDLRSALESAFASKKY